MARTEKLTEGSLSSRTVCVCGGGGGGGGPSAAEGLSWRWQLACAGIGERAEEWEYRRAEGREGGERAPEACLCATHRGPAHNCARILPVSSVSSSLTPYLTYLGRGPFTDGNKPCVKLDK